MSFDIVVRETFKGGPVARVRENYSTSVTCNSLEDVVEFMESSMEDIRRRYEVIREWKEVTGNKVIRKVLFQRPAKHGRLLRTYAVSKVVDHKPVYDDSLI